MRLSRRRFLQVGVAGAAVLVAARWLDRGACDERIVAALVPVILSGALPTDAGERASAVARVTAAVGRAIEGLAPAAREEVGELFSVLRFAPTRIATTGVWMPIPESAAPDIEAFLTRWRDSRFDLLRAGYQGLTQLVLAGWYGDAGSWASVGYPGPPALAR